MAEQKMMKRPCEECGRAVGLSHVFTLHKKAQVSEKKKVTFVYECTVCGNTVQIEVRNNR